MLLRQQGLSQEAAYQRLGEEITRRYQEWYVALVELPLWGEEIDTQVQRYVAALQETVLANLNWRFVIAFLYIFFMSSYLKGMTVADVVFVS